MCYVGVILPLELSRRIAGPDGFPDDRRLLVGAILLPPLPSSTGFLELGIKHYMARINFAGILISSDDMLTVVGGLRTADT